MRNWKTLITVLLLSTAVGGTAFAADVSGTKPASTPTATNAAATTDSTTPAKKKMKKKKKKQDDSATTAPAAGTTTH